MAPTERAPGSAQTAPGATPAARRLWPLARPRSTPRAPPASRDGRSRLPHGARGRRGRGRDCGRAGWEALPGGHPSADRPVYSGDGGGIMRPPGEDTLTKHSVRSSDVRNTPRGFVSGPDVCHLILNVLPTPNTRVTPGVGAPLPSNRPERSESFTIPEIVKSSSAAEKPYPTSP